MAPLIPEDPDTLLRRRETAEALTAKGFKTAEKTLATKATRGGGPPYRLYGRTPVYRWGDSLAWALARLSEPRSTTSEAEAQNSAACVSDHIGEAQRRNGAGEATALASKHGEQGPPMIVAPLSGGSTRGSVVR
jgi:hypothetical protein